MIGETVSHYRILEKLGEGGMGVVYKAEDTRLHRAVALKFLNPALVASESEKVRFEHEAQAAARLSHPNIATVYDFEDRLDPTTSTLQAFIAMEFIEGESLKRKIARGALPFNEAQSITRQLASALDAAHRKGIVHRDVKPANIIVRDDGSVKVLDFGVAKLADETRVTAAGHVVGSIAYMSPEQVQGDDVDLRSDIWSFGAVLYEMLTQHLPFRGDHAAAVVYSIVNEEPQPPGSLRKDIPPPLEAVCLACLRKDRAERPESMETLLPMLEGRAKPKPEKRRQTKRVSPLWRFAATALGVVTIVAALTLTIPAFRDGMERVLGIGTGSQKILVVLPFAPIDSSVASRNNCAALSWMVPSRLAELLRSDRSIVLIEANDVSSSGVLNAADAYKVIGASLVIRGHLQTIGEIVRLAVDLVDPKNNTSMDSRNGSYTTGSYTAMENDVVTSIIAMLGLKSRVLPEGTLARGTGDNEAYEFYTQGRGYLLQVHRKEILQFAADLFSRAIHKDSLFARAYAGLGETYWYLYEETNDTLWVLRANRMAQRAVALKATLPEAQITLGLVNSGTAQYEQAAENFRNAITLDPINSSALRGLANTYNSLGRYAEAEAAYKQAIELNSSYWAGYNALGYFYYTRGRISDALAQFKKVTSLAPDNVNGYNNAGAMDMIAQRWDDAARAFQRVQELGPTSYTYSNLGSVYTYLKDFTNASHYYEEALKLDSSDYRVWGSLASAQYWVPGERERAIATYKKAAELGEIKRNVDPRDAEVLSHLADFYAMMGEKERAARLAEQSLQGAKNVPEILERGAETYAELGEKAKALECLKGALEAGYDPGLIELTPGLEDLLKNEEVRKLMENKRGKNK